MPWVPICDRADRTQCPLWVKSGHMQCINPRPLYPRKQTCALQLVMSAKGQKRTCALRLTVPATGRSGIGASLDQLIGAGEQRWRHRKAKYLGSLEIDDEVVLGWGLNRQIACLFTFEDAVHIAGGAAVLAGNVRAVGEKSTMSNIHPIGIGRRQSITCSQ